MKIHAMVPELMVSNLSQSLAFWCDVVGFSVWYDRPEAHFAFLTLGDAQLMLEQYNADDGRSWVNGGVLQAPFGRGMNLQIAVPDLDAVIARCAQRNISLFWPLEERWYRRDDQELGQRQCIVADPDGYLARCVQSLGTRPAQQP